MRYLIICLMATSIFLQVNSSLAAPPDDKRSLIFSDDFTGNAIDTSKWGVENFSPSHIISSRWAENILVADGICKLITKKERRGGKEWTSAHMWTKNFAPKYGYFESRIRYAGAPGLNNAFWLMPLTKDGISDFEIDINEGKYPTIIDTNIHNWSGQKWEKQFRRKIDEDLSKNFHVYGLKWNKNYIVWYFDGKEIRRESNYFNSRGANVRFSTAVMEYLNPGNSLHMKSMDIDYIHVYALDE